MSDISPTTSSVQEFFDDAFMKKGIQPLQVIADPAMMDSYINQRMALIEDKLKAAIDIFMETGKSPMIDMGDNKVAFISRDTGGNIVAYTMTNEQAARFQFPEDPEDGLDVLGPMVPIGANITA